jgi:hypothetical protein
MVSKNRKMGDFSDFEREQIVGARLAGASLTNPDTLLGVSRATISKVVCLSPFLSNCTS